MDTTLIVLFLVLPLVLAAVLPLVGRLSKRVLPDILANAALLVLVIDALLLSRRLPAAEALVHRVTWFGEPLGLKLAVDGFSIFLLLAVAVVSLCVGLFSIPYMEHFGAKANYYALFLVMVAGMNGLILSTDLFGIYVFLEVAAVASYALVAFGLGRDEIEAAFKYLMLSVAASAFILLSIAVIFFMTGSLALTDVARALGSIESGPVVAVCSGLFLVGFGLKAALIPFHAWLPDAHPSAPAPISAMLSGLLIKVSGVYAMTRIFFNVFGLTPALSMVLMILGSVSIVVAAFLALGQKDLKRMLAYSSISQVGYVILGLGLGTPLGIAGGLFHLFNHALAKGLLFLNSGSIQNATGTRNLDEMGGLARRMPITATTSLIGSLSIAGVPPLNGFWSKLIIIIALIQAKQGGFALVAVLASILTLWYYLLFQRKAFFGKPEARWDSIREAPFWMTVSTVVLGLLCIGIGIFFSPVFAGWVEPAAGVLSKGVQFILGTWGF